MPVTIGVLVRDRSLGLRVVNGGAEASEVRIGWAHSSDLVDPTPWLEPDQLLLTNGPTVGEENRWDWPAYVARLAASGVGALGFATEVVHDVIPPALVDACREVDLPLLEVPGGTPFIAIIRTVAEAIAKEQRSRLEWSLSAQRALARAALQPVGLFAVLHELERRLDCWVALYDATGVRVPVPSVLPLPAGLDAELGQRVRAVLARGQRAGARLTTGSGDVTLQTLGQRDHLLGVLAVGTAVPLDPAGSDLVTSVIALASIALEQSRALDEARGHLRAGLLELMLAGTTEVAAVTAQRVWGGLPNEPVRVTVIGEGSAGEPLLRDLELLADRSEGEVFFGRRADLLVVVSSSAGAEQLTAMVQDHGLTAGVSGTGEWRALPRLLAEASRAGQRASAAEPIVRFESMFGDGMVALMDHSGAREVATRLLAPLTAAPDGAVLRESLRSWLDHNGAWDPAARALGIHRHTLRNRVTAVERLLDLDLDTFAARTELWVALQFDDE